MQNNYLYYLNRVQLEIHYGKQPKSYFFGFLEFPVDKHRKTALRWEIISNKFYFNNTLHSILKANPTSSNLKKMWPTEERRLSAAKLKILQTHYEPLRTRLLNWAAAATAQKDIPRDKLSQLFWEVRIPYGANRAPVHFELHLRMPPAGFGSILGVIDTNNQQYRLTERDQLKLSSLQARAIWNNHSKIWRQNMGSFARLRDEKGNYLSVPVEL